MPESLFLNKVAGVRPATLLKRRLWFRYFSMNFAKFLISFLQNTSRRLFLLVCFILNFKYKILFQKYDSTDTAKSLKYPALNVRAFNNKMVLSS